MDKPTSKIVYSTREEMRKYVADTMMELGRLIFANLRAFNRIKAQGISESHPTMQFLTRERIHYLKQIQELKKMG